MSESQPSSSPSHGHQTELEKLIRSLIPWFSENATTLIYALAAFLAVAAAYIYMQRTPDGNVEASRSLLLAVSPEDFRDIADEFPDTKIGMWSRLRQADRLRDDAVSHLFTDRAVGLEELDKSEAAYHQLADRTDLGEHVRERVLIGLARIADAHCDGTQESADAAIAAYQRVADEFDNSIDMQHCLQRINDLTTDSSKSFYAWFHEQNPSPASAGLAPGQPGVPGIPDADAPKFDLGTPDSTEGVSTSPDTERKAVAPVDEAKSDADEKGEEDDSPPPADGAAAEEKSDAAEGSKTESSEAPAEKAKDAAEEAKDAAEEAKAPAEEAKDAAEEAKDAAEEAKDAAEEAKDAAADDAEAAAGDAEK